MPIVLYPAVYGTNQAMVQRYLSLPSLEKAKQTVWVVLPMVIVLITILSAAGLVVFAAYSDCDPIATHRVTASDQLFPLFVMDTLGSMPGVPGLFVAGIFSGALSTVSSGVNSLAATTLEDFVKGYFCPFLSEKKATLYTKFIAVFYGLLSIALVAVAQEMGNVLTAALALFGLLAAPVLALFVLGMFFPSANAKGAFWGTIIGITSSMWVGIGGLYYKPYHPRKPTSVAGCGAYLNGTTSFHDQSYLDAIAAQKLAANDDIFAVYKLSYFYYGLVGAGVTIIAGLIISHITGRQKDEDADPSLFVPFVQARLVKAQAKKVANSIGDSVGFNDKCYHKRSCNCLRTSNNANPHLTAIQLTMSSNGQRQSPPLPLHFDGVINIAFEPDYLKIPRVDLTRSNRNLAASPIDHQIYRNDVNVTQL